MKSRDLKLAMWIYLNNCLCVGTYKSEEEYIVISNYRDDFTRLFGLYLPQRTMLFRILKNYCRNLTHTCDRCPFKFFDKDVRKFSCMIVRFLYKVMKFTFIP